MSLTLRACSAFLALSLALPLFAPASAEAASGDSTNEIVAFGLLGAVLGIVVYLGWQMDKEDRQQKTEDLLRQALADTGEHGQLMLICPASRSGEQITGLGYGVAF